MEQYLRIQILFIVFIFVMNTTIHAFNPQDICTTLSGQNSEQLNECIKRYEKAMHIKLWDTIDTPMNLDALSDHLILSLKNMGLETELKKPYLTSFLTKVNDIVTDISSENEKIWGDTYISKIQKFSEIESLLQNFIDEERQLSTAIDTLIDQKKRLHSLTEVFLQQLSGIPTRYLILGKIKWDTTKPGYKYDNYISKKASSYINKELAATLIFSNTIIENSTIVRSVIHNIKSIQVEEHGADPKTIQYENERYLMQIYRCYPRYDNNFIEEEDHSGTEENTLIIEFEPEYVHMDDAFFSSQSMIDHYTKAEGLIEEAKLLVKKVEKENELNINKIEVFDKRYKKSMQIIEDKKNETLKKLWDVTNVLTERIYYDLHKNKEDINFIDIRNKISKPVSQLENLNIEDINKASEIKTRIVKYLESKRALIIKLKKKQVENIVNLIKQKKMLVYTIKSKNIGTYDDPKIEAVKLLKGVLRTLNQRKKQFQAYELSVVDNGNLVTSKVSSYYNEGFPTRCLIFPAVLQHPVKQALRLSLFLALEVEYTKKSDQEKLLVYQDSNNNLSWFLDINECFSFDESKKRLPAHFRFPTKDQMLQFRNFLANNQLIMDKHLYLLKGGNEMWTREDDFMTGKIFTYDYAQEKFSRHSKSFCAFSIGVKSK